MRSIANIFLGPRVHFSMESPWRLLLRNKLRHWHSLSFFYFIACSLNNVAQKMKFSIKDFFSECDEICRKLRILSHLLKKSLMGNFIFSVVKHVVAKNKSYVCWPVEPAINFIIFWNFSIFCQIFLSPQVKRCAIITYKHGIYELPHELPNDLGLRKLGTIRKLSKLRRTIA